MRAEALWPDGARLLVAVSGGPDSTALLLILAPAARVRGIELVAAYFNHQLRGEEASSAESEAVTALAARAGVRLVAGAADVRERARSEALSLEEAARVSRYAFLAQAALDVSATAVATGHTASDQAETVLLHVVRGSGMAGLGGMAPRSPWPFPGHPGLTLVRPLLCLSRSETAAYCAAAGIVPVQDETNLSPVHRRNRLRAEVLPLLAILNPRIEAALVRLAAAARDDESYFAATVSRLLSAASPGEGPLTLPLSVLTGAPAALRGRLLRAAWERIAVSPRWLTARHVDAIERLLASGKTGDRLQLPLDVTVERGRDALVLARGPASPEALPDKPVQLAVPGDARIGPFLVRARPAADRGSLAVGAEVDAAAVEGGVRVRRRRPGDRFQPAGMTATKKLQDFFVDARVPRAERDRILVFEGGRGIVWLGGLRLAEDAKPRPGMPSVVLSFGASESADPQS